jgi:hypothetical protein
MFRAKFTNLLAAALFASATTALADGGGADGSANTVDRKLVEDLRALPQEICGYDEFSHDLQKLKQMLPGFGTMLESQLNKTEWYLVPRKIREEPEESTKLRFQADQQAYQPPHDNEIFLDDSEQDATCAEDKEEAGRVMMHEFVESLLENKDTTATRHVIEEIYPSRTKVQEDKRKAAGKKVIHRDPDPIKIQEALAANNFGVYFTANQYAIMAKDLRLLYLADMQARLARALRECQSGSSTHYVQRGLINPSFRVQYGIESDLKWDDTFLLNGEGDLLSMDDNSSNWLPPFGLHGSKIAPDERINTNEAVSDSCEDLYQGRKIQTSPLVSQAVCQKFDFFRPRRNNSERFKTEPEAALLKRSIDQVYSDLDEDRTNALVLPIQEDLAKRDDYITIMALSLTSPIDLDSEFPEADDKVEGRVKKIFEKALDKSNTLKSFGTKGFRPTLCKSVESLFHEVINRAENEFDSLNALKFPVKPHPLPVEDDTAAHPPATGPAE